MFGRTVRLILPFIALSALAAGRDVTTPTSGPTLTPLSMPLVASNGETFLTVWVEDLRNIRGSLADAKGRVLTPVSLSLLAGGGNRSLVDAASVGTNYVILWWDHKDGLHLAEISPSGAFLKTTKLAIPSFGGGGQLAWNGQRFMLIAPTSNTFPGSQDVAYVLDRNGAVLRSTPLSTSTFASDVAVVGDEFVVVAAQPGIFIYRFSSDGALISSTMIGAGPMAIPPVADVAVAPHGDGAAVLWSEFGRAQGVHLVVVSRTGVVTSNQTLPIGDRLPQRFVDLVPASNGYAAVLNLYRGPNGEDAGTFLIRLDPDGKPLDNDAVRVSDPSTASGATIGTTLFTAAGPMNTAAGLLEGMAVDTITLAATPATLSISEAPQFGPSVTSDGLDFFTSFGEETFDRTKAKAARFTWAGVPLDGAGLDVASDPGTTYTATAFGGSTYIVMWANDDTTYFRRYDLMGNAIDAAPVALGPGYGTGYRFAPPVVAWNGRRFLAVWNHDTALYGASIPTAGSAIGAQTTLAVPAIGSHQTFADPDLAFDGEQFLMVFAVLEEGAICCGPVPRQTRALRLSAEGIPFQEAPVEIAESSVRARVASNGGGFLITIDGGHDVIDGLWRYTLATAAARIAGETLRIDAPRVLFRWGEPMRSDVTWDGHDYVLTWAYALNAWEYGPLKSFLGSARVQDDGLAFDMRAIETALGTPYRGGPAIAANSQGDVAIVNAESRVRAYFLSDLDTLPGVPEPPTSFVATLNGSRITISWGPPPPGVIGYYSEKDEGDGYIFGNTLAAADRSATIYLGSPNPTRVRVRLRAINAAGYSAPSAWVEVTTATTTPVRRRSARH